MSKLYTNIKLIILIACVIWTQPPIEATDSYCPRFCQCSLLNERNYADCSAKRLINPSLDILPEVEVLNLSYNDITNIDNICFKHYPHLIELLISHNAIQAIDLDAFRNLPLVTGIDLSYNRLEYLDERLFEANSMLHTLNLEGNKFMSHPMKPLLISSSIKSLNLRNSQLHSISTVFFYYLPQLQQLDLSENLLITVAAEALQPLTQLQQLNLMRNPWNCDEPLWRVVNTMRKRAVDLQLDECQLKFQKFSAQSEGLQRLQRMELLESSELQNMPQNAGSSSKNIHKPWRKLKPPNNEQDEDHSEYDYSKFDYNDYLAAVNSKKASGSGSGSVCEGTRAKLCKSYHLCLSKLANANTFTLDRDLPIYSDSDFRIAFLLGVAVGITICILLTTCVLCIRNCADACKKRKPVEMPNYSYAEPENMQHNIVQPLPSAPQQLPPGPSIVRPTRRSRRRAPACPNTQVQRPYHEIFPERDNFFTRLFGRPARHQYYRTLNQNTATLIRRLSRSNLFNSRFAERNERNAENESAPTTPTTPATHWPDEPDFEEVARDQLAAARPETPPPNYGDVVVNCEQKST